MDIRHFSWAVAPVALAALAGAACTPPDSAEPETVGTVSEALVNTSVFTTGIGLDGGAIAPGDGSASGPTDPHYSLTQSNDPRFPAGSLPTPLYVVTTDTGTVGTWAPATTTGHWISPFPSSRAPTATAFIYHYTTTFTMPGTIVDPTKVVLTGAWACDDSCTLLLNGTQVAANQPTGGGHASGPTTTAFTIPEGSPFVAGTNTLDFVINNSGGYETGLLVTSLVCGCTADSQCTTATEFCDTQNGPCTPKLGNGNAVPTLSGHTPALTGTCSAAVGTAVCSSGVCDTTNSECGLVDGKSCADAGASVCQSGTCNAQGTCGASPPPGCTLDTDCSATQWCNTGTGACTPKLGNGTTVPTVSGHTPPLTGTCSAAVGTAVCSSGVCDTTNSKCGLVDGKSCADAGASVCESGMCNAQGTCGASPPPGCTLDTDCSAIQWCNTGTGACTPKLGNGTTVPTVSGHTPPLTGTCSAAVGTAVCSSGVCDTTNSECGLVDGKSCADAGASVCQSGMCNAQGTCGASPPPGCTLDTDCSAIQWCNTGTGACTPKLGNGTTVPTVSGHTPPLTGTCSAAVGTAVCSSGVCDTTNSECGLVDGKSCADAGASVCQSGTCNAQGTCGASPPPGCTLDTDCSATQWCNTGTGACTPKLGNGTTVPTVSGHTPPLTGTCSAAVGTAVCSSGVCDTTNSECGLVDGKSCADAGASVCQSGMCNAQGTCGASPPPGCTLDTDCSATQWCNTGTGACTPKLGNGTTVPTVSGHIPPLTGTCSAAVGSAVCSSGVCDTTNSECGLVDGKSCADAGASVCQSGMCNAQGTCGASPPPGCTLDTDCSATQWCNTSTGACTPKLGNGTTVPTVSGHTPPLTGTCSAAVGTAVCSNGVCDISNNECGLVDGKSCADAGASVCQSGTCNAQGTCGASPPPGCTLDTDCSATQWCNTSTGACTPKLGNGTTVPTVSGHTPPLAGACTAAAGSAICASGVCDPNDNACGLAKGDGPCTPQDGANVCRTGTCLADFSVCGDGYVPSGSGFGCSMTRAGETRGAGGASLGMALLAAFASVARRRRAAKRTG